MNKVWQKPKLIVLYRGRPEESVLVQCKIGLGTARTTVNNKNNDCYRPGCGLCSEIVDT